MPIRTYPQWKRLLEGTALPATLVDLDAFDRNVAKLERLAPVSKTIRLASKSIRVPELMKRAIKSSPHFRGLMCFSAKEALWLSESGVTQDILLAYPTYEREDLNAILSIYERGHTCFLMVDSFEGIEKLALLNSSKPLRVLIDLDCSLRPLAGLIHLGVRRSPVRTADQVVALAKKIQSYRPKLEFAGVMAYEAQVAGLGDKNPFHRFLNPFAHIIRSLSARRVSKLRNQVSAALQENQLPARVFNGAGTGSFNIASSEEALTELTAGSALFSPHLFDYYRNISFEPSMFFALPVVRSCDPNYVTCLGGGYIASGSPGWDKVPIVISPEGARLVSTEGCGEVQTPIRLESGMPLQLGDPVIFRHAKAGELMERFEEVILVSNGQIIGKAKTYRGYGKCFF